MVQVGYIFEWTGFIIDANNFVSLIVQCVLFSIFVDKIVHVGLKVLM